jgi:nucleoside-diphosphate-sugar epimerase
LPTEKILILGTNGFLSQRINRRFRQENKQYQLVGWRDVITIDFSKFRFVINLSGPSRQQCNDPKILSEYYRFIKELALGMKRAPLSILIHISTNKVYANNRKITEESDLLGDDCYQISRINAEKILLHKLKSENLNIIRLSNCFGGWEHRQSCDELLYHQIVRNLDSGFFKLNSSGDQILNFISAKTFENSILAIVEQKPRNAICIYNLGQYEMSVKEFSELTQLFANLYIYEWNALGDSLRQLPLRLQKQENYKSGLIRSVFDFDDVSMFDEVNDTFGNWGNEI